MSNPTYDAALFADSMSEQPAFDPVIDHRSILDVRDSNQGSYASNDVIFDCKEAGSGSDLFCPPGEGVAMIPITLAMASVGGKFEKIPSNKFCMALKNTIYQLVNSTTVSINGVEVVSARQNLGMVDTYKLMAEWSPADEAASGPSYGFAMDTSDSTTFNDALGEMNNDIVGAVKAPDAPASMNEGRFNRAKWASTTAEATFDKFQTLANLKLNCFRSTCTIEDNLITQELMVCIPLRKLHPLFEALPMLCKSHIQITMNLNVCNTTLTLAAGVVTNQTTNQPNRVCPYTITTPSSTANSGLRTEAAVTSLAVTMSVGNTMQKQCILRLHRYRLSPEAISKLMDRGPYTVRYNDYFSRKIENQNQLNGEQITAPVQRVRRLIVIPQTTRASNGTAGVAPYASALSSAPATAQPYWACHQLQVTLSGESIYSAPLSYSYAQWLSEIQSSGSMNGGFSDNLKSGLITEYDWQTGYGVLDINLARHTKGNDDPAVQVAISFTGQHKFNSDYFIFLEYGREFTINQVSGEITK